MKAINFKSILKRRWLRWLIVTLLLLAAISCILGSRWLSHSLLSQQAAARWAGDSDLEFAQVSYFLPVDKQVQKSDIYQFRQTVQEKLDGASLVAPENGSLYSDAWSAVSSVEIKGDRGSASAQVIGVGGNFFLFHPFKLLNGSYISESDLMQDRVVLDEDLAWTLFGSSQLAGSTVTIGGKPYLVAGVIEREQDRVSKLAYTGGAGLFMSYDALYDLDESLISCYERVMADPVEGFALDVVKSNFPESAGVAVENSARFGLEEKISVLRNFGYRSMNTSGVVFPYWENAARYVEDWSSLLILLAALLLLYPLVLAVITLVRLIRLGKRKLVDFTKKKHEEMRNKAYYRRVAKQQQKQAADKLPEGEHYSHGLAVPTAAEGDGKDKKAGKAAKKAEKKAARESKRAAQQAEKKARQQGKAEQKAAHKAEKQDKAAQKQAQKQAKAEAKQQAKAAEKQPDKPVSAQGAAEQPRMQPQPASSLQAEPVAEEEETRILNRLERQLQQAEENLFSTADKE